MQHASIHFLHLVMQTKKTLRQDWTRTYFANLSRHSDWKGEANLACVPDRSSRLDWGDHLQTFRVQTKIFMHHPSGVECEVTHIFAYVCCFYLYCWPFWSTVIAQAHLSKTIVWNVQPSAQVSCDDLTVLPCHGLSDVMIICNFFSFSPKETKKLGLSNKRKKHAASCGVGKMFLEVCGLRTPRNCIELWIPPCPRAQGTRGLWKWIMSPLK